MSPYSTEFGLVDVGFGTEHPSYVGGFDLQLLDEGDGGVIGSLEGLELFLEDSQFACETQVGQHLPDDDGVGDPIEGDGVEDVDPSFAEELCTLCTGSRDVLHVEGDVCESTVVLLRIHREDEFILLGPLVRVLEKRAVYVSPFDDSHHVRQSLVDGNLVSLNLTEFPVFHLTIRLIIIRVKREYYKTLR